MFGANLLSTELCLPNSKQISRQICHSGQLEGVQVIANGTLSREHRSTEYLLEERRKVRSQDCRLAS